MRDIPNIKKEIRSLKKVKGDFGELKEINQQLESNKVEIRTHLDQIH